MQSMKRIVSFFVLAAAAVTTAFAQVPQAALGGASPDRAVADAAKAEGELRARLAEEILAARETPGREFSPRYRAMLTDKLKTLSIEELQKRRATGLILTPDALGDTSADLTYTPFAAPCRVIDTRIGGGALSGGAPGPSRSFMIAGSTNLSPQGGSATGCGVPVGATAVLINFVAVNPQGLGNLRGAAFPNSVPATGSIVNYQALTPVLNVANGLLFPICDPAVSTCTFDITLLANGVGTDVVADVLGYAMKFPKQQVQSFSIAHQSAVSGAPGIVTGGCTTASSFTVAAPVAGAVHVRANVIVNWQHTMGQASPMNATVSNSSGDCVGQQAVTRDYIYDPDHATSNYNVTLRPEGTFPVSAGPATFYLNDNFLGTTTDTATVFFVGWIVTFEPN